MDKDYDTFRNRIEKKYKPGQVMAAIVAILSVIACLIAPFRIDPDESNFVSMFSIIFPLVMFAFSMSYLKIISLLPIYLQRAYIQGEEDTLDRHQERLNELFKGDKL